MVLASSEQKLYHFGVKVFDILGVENSHESLGAHSLAAVFLPHHQRYVFRVVLEVVDEWLALASDCLRDKDTSFINVRKHFELQNKQQTEGTE